MKKALSLLLALCLLAAPALAAPALAASGEASGSSEAGTEISLSTGDWTYTRSGSGADAAVTITQFAGDPDENGVVVVPAILGGGTVTAVGMTAFRNASVRAILLPASVERVGEWAFYDCTSLAYVSSANAELDVDEAAFQNSPAAVTGAGEAVEVSVPTGDTRGFALLLLGVYILPEGVSLPALTPGENGVLRDDAKGELAAEGTNWLLKDYDAGGVDLAADEPQVLVIAESLADYGLSPSEVNKTFRALTADEAAARNEAVAASSFAAYASRLTFEEGFYLNGGRVAVDPALVCYDAATGEVLAALSGDGDASSLCEDPRLDAPGVRQAGEPYRYVAFRDADGDGDIDVLFYADTSLAAGGETQTTSGTLAFPGLSGTAYCEELAGKAGRPQLDGAYLSFENGCLEAGPGETLELASAELATADGSVQGSVNQERSLLWADGGGSISVGTLTGVSSSEGNWTKIRDENNSYAGQPMEVVMQWGVGAALFASQGGVLRVGDPDGARSRVFACGDGANGALATGILDGDRPSQVYVYNTDFVLEGWNNHVVDTIYGGYVYLEDVCGETGRAGSYILNNGSTLANDFGDGTVEVRDYSGVAWGDSSAGIYVIGSGSVRAEASSFTSHLNAAIKAVGGDAVMTDCDLCGMNGYSGSSATARFDGGVWTLHRDYAGDGYVYGAAAAEIAQLWYDVTGGTALLSYVMSGVGNRYAQLCDEYAEEIEAWGGREAFYAAVNDVANRYGYGEAYHASDDALLRNSMFDNTFYAIMRNGFQYSPEDGVYRLDVPADWSDVPYLGASNRKCFPVSFFDASGAVEAEGVSFVYDDSIGADYRWFSTGSGAVTLTECVGASGLVGAGTIRFVGTDFEGSFAAGSKGLWDGPVGYYNANGEYTFRNGNYSGGDAAGATAEFSGGSVWTVTHDSYLAGLTLAEDAVVAAPAGYALTFYVDGAETELAPGVWAGEIALLLTAED